MKSSSAIFTRQNPFPTESHVARTHYNPSRAKKITKPQKKLALSPVRFSNLSSPPEVPPQTASLSLGDQRLLEGSHHVFCPLSVKEDKPCSESWASVDLGSSASVGGSIYPESHTSQPHHPVTIPIIGTQKPSALAKYVERFRYGRPQSREERRKSAADEDRQTFWWPDMSSSLPSSSTPTQPSVECLRGDMRNDGDGSVLNPDGFPRSCISPTRGQLDLSVLALSESSDCEPGESETLQLQERARWLLQKSEHSLSRGSSAVPISSEGLGCSDFSSPVTNNEPIPRPMMPSFTDSDNMLTMPRLSGGHLLPSPPALGPEGRCFRPEDDILFQWRLRRKMEQAREWSQTPSYSSLPEEPLLSRLPQQKTQSSPISADLVRRANLHFTAAPEEASCSLSTQATQEPALPISNATVPKPRPISNATVPKPCPISNATVPKPRPISNATVPKPRPISNATVPKPCPISNVTVPKPRPISNATVPKPRPISNDMVTKLRPEACIQTFYDSITGSHSDNIPQPTEKRGGREPRAHCSTPRPHARGQKSSSENSAEPCSKHQSPCPPPPPPKHSESTEQEGHGLQQRAEVEGKGVAQVERGKRKTVPSIQMRKSDTQVGGQSVIQRSRHNAKANRKCAKGQEEVSCKSGEPSRKLGSQSRSQSSTGDICSGDLVPPPSPIRNTLGQVVSEVLFLGPDSSVQPVSPAQSHALLPHGELQPCDVITELMQEAQQSDGLEFEDDPLLLVLRQQRKWVKEQICEVDMMLEELHED